VNARGADIIENKKYNFKREKGFSGNTQLQKNGKL